MPSLFQRGVRKLRRIVRRKLAALRSPADVAVIGFGAIAPDHVDAYEASGIARVVAVCDVRPAALAGALWRRPYLRAFRDYRAMIREVRPDVVSICTWPQTHAEIVAAAAAEGVKGILCEKPLALRLSDIEAMAAECRRHGVKLACGHQYRFHPNFVPAARRSDRASSGRSAWFGGTLAARSPTTAPT